MKKAFLITATIIMLLPCAMILSGCEIRTYSTDGTTLKYLYYLYQVCLAALYSLYGACLALSSREKKSRTEKANLIMATIFCVINLITDICFGIKILGAA